MISFNFSCPSLLITSNSVLEGNMTFIKEDEEYNNDYYNCVYK